VISSGPSDNGEIVLALLLLLLGGEHPAQARAQGVAAA